MVSNRCYLCAGKQSDQLDFEGIDSAIAPASKKPIKLVLQHLANCIKTKLDFADDACVCPNCLRELSEYDDLMLKLLTFQKRLTKLLETTLNADDYLDDTYEDNRKPKGGEEIMLVENIEEDGENMFVLECSETDEHDDPTKEIRRYRECTVCTRAFKTKSQLAQHVVQAHDNPPVYACHICGVVRRDEEYLELHMNVHEGKTENECRYCNKRYSRPVNTLRHMRKHWDKKKFQCEKCGVRFSQDNLLYNHKLLHDAEENPLICGVCNQSFRTKKTYNHHMLIHQENRKRHQCQYCSKSFTERYTLKMHLKSHPEASAETERDEIQDAANNLEDKTRSSAVCVICGLQVESKEALDEHLEQEHDVIL